MGHPRLCGRPRGGALRSCACPETSLGLARSRTAGAPWDRPAHHRNTVAKPSDDPQFFHWPPPPGRSRESSIRLGAQGRFFHADEAVEHEGLARAMHAWIGKHPIDGRMVLVNGYDWTYFQVDDVPYFIEGIAETGGDAVLHLSDGSQELWIGDGLYAGEMDALYTWVKHEKDGGPYLAKFRAAAQLGLEPWVEERDGAATVVFRGKVLTVAPRAALQGLPRPHSPAHTGNTG